MSAHPGAIALLFFLLPAQAAIAARVVEATPQDYSSRIAGLKPGDTLLLAAGEYSEGLRIHRISGTREAPIVIRGPASGAPAILVARPKANTVSIIDAAHVVIRDLVVDGRGVPVDGVKAEGHGRWSHHITLENLTIVNHGENQQIVGISTKSPAWGWVIRGNRIHGAGTGMYLGNSDGSAPFYGGLIEHNLVTDPRGYAIQIKHQHARPALEHAPKGRHVTVIRHNVLSKASGGSSGGMARPNLLLGHWPLSGEGAQDEYLVYGNFIVDNPHEALLQAEGNVAVYNNIFRNRHGPGIHIQPHMDVPREVRILYNTIVTSAEPIVVRLPETGSTHTQVVAWNAVFSPHPIQGGKQIDNAAHGLEDAGTLLVGGNDRGPYDFYPRNERLVCAPPAAGLLERLQDIECDFNGRRRAAAYCGAYAGHGQNPGRRPSLAVKPASACSRE